MKQLVLLILLFSCSSPKQQQEAHEIINDSLIVDKERIMSSRCWHNLVGKTLTITVIDSSSGLITNIVISANTGDVCVSTHSPNEIKFIKPQ